MSDLSQFQISGFRPLGGANLGEILLPVDLRTPLEVHVRFMDPERSRHPLDPFFVVAFGLFAFTSLFLEQWIVFGVDLRTATDPVGRAWRWYAETFDPLLFEGLLSIRVMFGIDAFVFGAFYLVLVYAFLRKRNWIQVPALLYGAAMSYSVVVYILMEAFSEHRAQTNLVMVLLIGAPYTIVPLLLIYRMWRPQPFGPPEAYEELPR